MDSDKSKHDIESMEFNLAAVATSLKHAIALIEQIRGGMGIRAPWKILREMFDNIIGGHFWLGYPISGDFQIFRGRVNNDVDTFDNISELKGRPKEKVADYGRCHRPGVSIFYGANNLDTVLSELSPEAGDHVHVAVARIKPNRSLMLTAIGEIEHVRRYEKPLIGDQETFRMIKQFLDADPSEMHLKTLILDAFLSDLFLARANSYKDYKATSALSDILHNVRVEEQEIDGFAYPSVLHHGGVNFAIRSERFDEIMDIHQCMAFEIIGYYGFGIYGRYQYGTSSQISPDGDVKWDLKKPQPA